MYKRHKKLFQQFGKLVHCPRSQKDCCSGEYRSKIKNWLYQAIPTGLADSLFYNWLYVPIPTDLAGRQP